jgi:chemotaxis protein histidine kinase CheA/ActR/RegA family two-component response regulator
MSNTFDKLSVLDSFIEEVKSYLPEIETNLERLAQSSGDMEALEETYRRTHTIGGSASMMDFPGLAHVAHGMEDILGDVLDNVTELNAPTLGLLSRSLQRMHRLIDGIRTGIDEEAMIAEDDADYMQYRTQMEALANGREVASGTDGADTANAQQDMPFAQMTTPSISSLDDMLESFRTPTPSGDELDWPEEPLSVSGSANAVGEQEELIQHETQPRQAAQPVSSSVPAQPTQPMPPVPPTPQISPNVWQEFSTYAEQAALEPEPAVLPDNAGRQMDEEQFALSEEDVTPVEAYPVQPMAAKERRDLPGESALVPLQTVGTLAQVYEKAQQDARDVEEQAATLKRTLTQLRLAASIIETQRQEFKGFLDGSKDALDRMEEWAGKAMGLNLRNSPEQVRRYLPLSVMWVANSKLKKVLDLLTQMAGSVEITEEQLRENMAQLHASLAIFGEVLEEAQAGPAFTHEPGWTPWEMRESRDNETLRERVTFERQGDIASLRSDIEARLREELLRELESRPVTRAARAELERQIRNEVREEFEARRRLQESVVGQDSLETLEQVEARLRSEIEIEVRREFLSQLTGEYESPSVPPQAASLVSSAQPLAVPVAPAPSPLSQPMTRVTSSTPSMDTDYGEEAADIFRQEAEEHLQTISMYVAQLENAPAEREPIQGIRRATHTLKGAAGMMGFRSIADLCHISEDLLDSIMDDAIAISPTVISIILDTAEALDALINNKARGSEAEAIVQSLRMRHAELLGEQSTLAQGVEQELEEEIAASEAEMMEEVSFHQVDASNQEAVGAQQMARTDLSVRVPLAKLDELVNLFGELLVNRSVLEERLQRLVRLVSDVGVSSNRLRDVGQKLESRFEAATLPSGRSVQVMPGQGNQNGVASGRNNGNHNEPAHLAEFDELELDRYTEFHLLARGLSEGISDMTTLSNEMEGVIRDCEGVFGRENRLNTTFQDRLMKARLVPLSTMIPRLYRTARAVALKQHKEFEFVLEGQETEVDRTVIEEIAGPLLHLMRNAVNHAIETPDVRVQQGKPAAGQIKLSAAYEGNQVVITVRDDGTGIDAERVRNAAIARGFVQPEQVLSDSDIIEFIFRPGFSTAEVLSEESGRGVGLDVVRDSVSRLRGTLEVESTPGQGTAFTMKFPTSLAIQNAMMVNVGDQQYAIPTVMVESIGRIDNFKQTTFAGRPALLVQNESYPIILLSQLLGLPDSTHDEKAPVVLARTDRYRVALIVDNIRGRMDVVMKNLGPHLRHVHGIAGGTVLGNGRVVLILELAELLTPRAGTTGMAAMVPVAPSRREIPGTSVLPQVEEAHQPAVPGIATRSTTIAPPARQAPAPAAGKHVLVVDDSPSVRRVVGNMLKQNNWEVQLARDGVEALEMITRETPAAVLLDIEMPRMDGYELMATIRAQEQYRTLPLVVLTSRAASKHQQRAMQLGANAYVVKPYQDEELLNILKSLVFGATV